MILSSTKKRAQVKKQTAFRSLFYSFLRTDGTINGIDMSIMYAPGTTSAALTQLPNFSSSHPKSSPLAEKAGGGGDGDGDGVWQGANGSMRKLASGSRVGRLPARADINTFIDSVI